MTKEQLIDSIHIEEVHHTCIHSDKYDFSCGKCIDKTIKEAVDGERERIKKWVVENHEHHDFADELPPQGCNGCVDKDYPYVNSMDLVDFIHPHYKDEKVEEIPQMEGALDALNKLKIK